MKIKDQIRARRDQLGITVDELARRVGVSGQSIRYWEAGRSYPGKSKTAALEAALSISLDWSEGAKRGGEKQAAAMIDQEDVDLLLLLCRLPFAFKRLLGDLARAHLEVVNKPGRSFSERDTHAPVQAFAERSGSGVATSGVDPGIKRSPSRRKTA